MKGFLHLFILSFFAFTVIGYSQVTFEASADATKIVQGNYVKVAFTVKNARGANFSPPPFRDFTVLAGPNTEMQTSIINGRTSMQHAFTYALQPKRLGKLRIGKASIVINGKKYSSKPLSIEVVKGAGNQADKKDEIFVIAEPSVSEAYIGQQIILDYNLYTSARIEFSSFVAENEYPGFYSQEVRRFDTSTKQEVINGRQYSKKSLKRIVLFPQQTGKLTIPPSTLQVTDRSSFIPRYRLNLETDSVEINVFPLPPNPPASFSGAVGQFKLQTSMNRTAITTDDALTLKMVISGNGDIKRVRPPALNLPGDFEIYDPQIINEGSFERQGGIFGQKEIEYLAVPKKTGDFSFRPEFSYYDPDSAKYVTINEKSFDLVIRKGSNAGNPIATRPNTQDNSSKVEDIRFIKMSTELYPKGQAFLGTSIFWMLFVLPFTLLLGAWGYHRILLQRSNLDPALLKHRRARKAAMKRLQTANQLMDKKQSRGFYDEISKAMLGYVSDKLKIPLSELTKENVKEKLDSMEVKESGIENFMKIIQTSEMALFAGKDNSEAMKDTYQNAVDVLSDIESDIKQ